MADETFLSDDLLRQLMSVGEVDLLVGILSHSSANTMRRAAHFVEKSLQQNFVRQRVAIISVDGGAVEDSDSDDAVWRRAAWAEFVLEGAKLAADDSPDYGRI